MRASRTFVLIQSFNSVNSPEVAKEEDLADRFGIPVIPFVTDDSELGKSLAYDLTSAVSAPEKAEKYLAMSSAMFERERDTCGGTHVYAWLAYTDMLYAKLYAGAGKRQQAVSYGHSSVDFSEKYYGREHYITLERLWSLAGVYRALGMRGEEKSLLLRLCGSYEKKQETQSAKYAAARTRLDEMNAAEAENGAAEQ